MYLVVSMRWLNENMQSLNEVLGHLEVPDKLQCYLGECLDLYGRDQHCTYKIFPLIWCLTTAVESTARHILQESHSGVRLVGDSHHCHSHHTLMHVCITLVWIIQISGLNLNFLFIYILTRSMLSSVMCLHVVKRLSLTLIHFKQVCVSRSPQSPQWIIWAHELGVFQQQEALTVTCMHMAALRLKQSHSDRFIHWRCASLVSKCGQVMLLPCLIGLYFFF